MKSYEFILISYKDTLNTYDMYIPLKSIKDPLRFLGCFQMISMFGVWAPDALPGGNPAQLAQNDTADVESKGTLESEGTRQ